MPVFARVIQGRRGCPSASGSLTSVDTVSSSELWATGYVGTPPALTEAARAWIGGMWTLDSPLPGTPSTPANATQVSALTAGPVWAAGSGLGATDGAVWRWSGIAWGNALVLPDGAFPDVLAPQGVTAVVDTDVWVSVHMDSSATRTDILQWDGGAWNAVPLTVDTPPALLLALANAGSTEVWYAGRNNAQVPVAGRVTGSSAGSEYVGTDFGLFYGLTVRSAGALVWAGGSIFPAPDFAEVFFVQAYTGTGWVDRSPPLPADYDPAYGTARVLGLDGTSSTDVWAGGVYLRTGGYFQPWLAHYDGAWAAPVTLPARFTAENEASINAVHARAADDVWAVGYFVCGGTPHPLALHYDGSGWTDRSPA